MPEPPQNQDLSENDDLTAVEAQDAPVEDEALRTNRLRLLNRFVSVFAHVADFGKMAKSKER